MAQIAPGCFICTSQDMHPYECDGKGKCPHCDRKTTPYHKVGRCAFCIEDANERRRDRSASR